MAVIEYVNSKCKEIIQLHKNNHIQTLMELFSLYNEITSFYDDKIDNIIIPIHNISILSQSNIRIETDKHIKNEYIKLKDLCVEEILGFVNDVIHKADEQ